jgi:hypothetical protein
MNPKDNSPLFAENITQITRRARLAAGVLGASLTLSTMAFAQGNPELTRRIDDQSTQTGTSKDPSKTAGTSQLLSGFVTDSNGAAIPNAVVTLTRVSNGAKVQISCNEEGEYRFSDFVSGSYKLEASASAFKASSVDIDLQEGVLVAANLALEPAVTVVTMGIIGFAEYSSPLFRAVSNDDIEALKELIANGADVNDKDDNYSGITPLFLAVENGNLATVEMLLEFGAKVNSRNDDRQTPLMRVDGDATVELVELLFKYGAKANLTDRSGDNALILAARNANPDVLRLLIRETDKIDSKNSRGRTALMEAADADNLENVRALIQAGADVNLKDSEGETAWDLTTDDEIEALLESYGGNSE